ncbi:SGNH/GDSL hydrolase family protein [Kribbella jejuensis]|uniref:GDSL-like lipase/acylhydrolase family protein n=1 Tax=Kribbella jejuensis TaxID=236068 RepID=A0A542ER44_9ACTN|nr:GDSL-type esterase/lipase family protein [Kribbella jejuensis]TQJ17684.1 GDSL-like lipase/acylhydrolase family protein [Kribbella jejuensis]
MTGALWTGFRHREVDTNGWSTFWRLDPRGHDFGLSDWIGAPDRPGHRLWERAATPAGVRAAWRTSAARVELDVRAGLGIYARLAPVDVLVDGELHHRCELREGEQTLRIALPARTSTVEIWLPQSGSIAVREPAFDGAAEPIAPSGPRWITYGSSITQCSGAAGPSETWPALVARRHGWDPIVLGLSGECHLDPIAARTIRDTPAELISLCLGINIYGGATYSGRTLPSAVEAFVATARSGHPRTRVVVITPLLVPDREGEANAVGLTLDDVRDCVTRGAQVDPAVEVIDGRKILTTDEARALYTDGLHPGPDGYRLIGERLGELLTPA